MANSTQSSRKASFLQSPIHILPRGFRIVVHMPPPSSPLSNEEKRKKEVKARSCIRRTSAEIHSRHHLCRMPTCYPNRYWIGLLSLFFGAVSLAKEESSIQCRSKRGGLAIYSCARLTEGGVREKGRFRSKRGLRAYRSASLVKVFSAILSQRKVGLPTCLPLDYFMIRRYKKDSG